MRTRFRNVAHLLDFRSSRPVKAQTPPVRRLGVEGLEDRCSVAEGLGAIASIVALAGAAQAAPPSKLRSLTRRPARRVGPSARPRRAAART
jgi:hypothetical protein